MTGLNFVKHILVTKKIYIVNSVLLIHTCIHKSILYTVFDDIQFVFPLESN